MKLCTIQHLKKWEQSFSNNSVHWEVERHIKVVQKLQTLAKEVQSTHFKVENLTPLEHSGHSAVSN